MKNLNIKDVGAITVIQPWAELILHHGKNVENRQKNSHYRGTIAIHSSQTKSTQWFEDCKIKIDPEAVAYGSIIGFANLVDVITKKEVSRKTQKWFQGEYGLVLTDIILLKKPIKMKGARGVWRLKGAALRKCLDQLKPSELKTFRPFTKIRATTSK